MNFMVQSLIQDLENMGRFPLHVSEREWQDKWTALDKLSPEEHAYVLKACGENTFRKKAFEEVKKHDPDPAKTARKAAFDGLFRV